MGKLYSCLFLSAILLCSLATQPCRAQGKPIVVVFDAEAKRFKLDKTLLVTLSDHLATLLTRSGEYHVVPRSELKARLTKQKKKSYKECYDQSCQVELGRELAAEKTISTQIIKLGKNCTVNLVLFDLKKAATEEAASQRGKCDEEKILETLERAVAELVGQNPPPQANTQPLTAPPPGAKTGTALILCNIEGAQISVDGEAKGVTKVRLAQVQAGDHQTTCSAAGYQSQQKIFKVRAGEQTMVSLNISRKEKKKSFSERFKGGLDTALEMGHETFNEGKESVGVAGAKAKEVTSASPAAEDVALPGGKQIWMRCPLGQSWKSDRCQGQAKKVSFFDARSACPKGYRLPRAEELTLLLGACDEHVTAGRTGSCSPCADSTTCAKMFGPDGRNYWTFSWDPNTNMVRTVSFSGRVDKVLPKSMYPVRCLRR